MATTYLLPGVRTGGQRGPAFVLRLQTRSVFAFVRGNFRAVLVLRGRPTAALVESV